MSSILIPSNLRQQPPTAFYTPELTRSTGSAALDRYSIWYHCKYDPNYDNTDNFLRACEEAASRGCSLYMSLQPGAAFTQLNIRRQVLIPSTLAGIIGDNQNASRGCCLGFLPSITDTVEGVDLRTGFVNQGSNIENILFIAAIRNYVAGTDNGMNPALPSTLTTAGVVAAWGPNNITSLVDPATFFANAAVQLLPGVGMYPGVIPLESRDACVYENVQTLYGKIGHWSASGSGHVFADKNCSFSGALIGEHYHINGQDYENNTGGRSGGLAAVTVGNTNSVNVIGGYTGSMKRIHFYGSGFGILQVQDYAGTTLAAQRPNGFAGTMESCSFELIGEELFHMYNPQDGTDGGLFSLEATNLNAGFDYEGGIYGLPANMLVAMGITHGKFGAQLGNVIALRGMQDFGNGAAQAGTFIAGGGTLSISNASRTTPVEFAPYGTKLPVRGPQLYEVPMAFTSPIPANFDDLANHRDFLTVGNLLPNPETGVNLTAAPSTTPGFYTANGGNWNTSNTDVTCQVKTLDAWRLAGTALNIDEATLAKMGPKTPIYKFTTVTAASLIMNMNPAAPFTDDRMLSGSFISSAGAKVAVTDSTFAFYYFGGVDADTVMESGTTMKYRRTSFAIRPGFAPGYWTLFLGANSTVYLAAPMVNYGRPAPYNPNRGPGLSAGHGIPTATAQPATLTAPGFWIDSSAGYVLKVAQ